MRIRHHHAVVELDREVTPRGIVDIDHAPPGGVPGLRIGLRGRAQLLIYSSSVPTVLAHVNGRLVGYLGYRAGRAVSIDTVWVAPRDRKRGLASTLLDLVLDIAQPRVAHAMAITRGGRQLLVRASATHPTIPFHIQNRFGDESIFRAGRPLDDHDHRR